MPNKPRVSEEELKKWISLCDEQGVFDVMSDNDILVTLDDLLDARNELRELCKCIKARHEEDRSPPIEWHYADELQEKYGFK